MYLGNTPQTVTRTDFVYLATAGQTIFTAVDMNGLVLSYDPNNFDVFANGVLLNKQDYAAATGSSITLNVARYVNDIVTVRAYGILSTINSLLPSKVNIQDSWGYGFRNKIINGNCLVGQRGTSFTILAGSTGYTADRWRIFNSTNQTVTIQVTRSTGIDYNNQALYPRMRISYATAPTSGNLFVTQRIEDVNTLAGEVCTMSFAQGFGETLTGSAYFTQNFGGGGDISIGSSVATFPSSIGGSISVTKLLFTLPSVSGKTIGSSPYLEWTLSLPIRTTNPVTLTDMSLVAGDATGEDNPYAPRNTQQEISLCQRFYQKSYNASQYEGSSSTPYGPQARFAAAGVSGYFPFPVLMRTTPTLTFYDMPGNPSKVTVVGSSTTNNVTITSTGITAQINGSNFNFAYSSPTPALGDWIQWHYGVDAEL